MEVYQDVPKEFLSKYERYEPTTLDNTALITYKECPTKYFYRFVIGITGRETPPYFLSGSAYHKYRENFEINWKINSDLPFQDRFDYSHLLANNDAINLWNKVSNNKEVLAPNTKWDWITRSRLQLSLNVASKWLQTEKKNNNIIVVATEQPFIVQVVEDVFWGGKADQVVRWNNRLWGRDFKTSSQRKEWFKRGLKPNNQFIGYTVAEELLHGNIVDGQLVEVLHNTKTEGPTITPYPTSFNVFEKGLWIKDLKVWNDRIKQSRETDHYPRSEKTCPFCPYHMVCSSTSESSMISVIDSNYKVSPWDFQNTEEEAEVAA